MSEPAHAGRPDPDDPAEVSTDGPDEVFEIVDGLPVVAGTGHAAPDADLRRRVDASPAPVGASLESSLGHDPDRRPTAAVGRVQTAAVAATGFVAGVATAAMLGRRRQRRLGRPAAGRPLQSPATAPLEVVSSRLYMVHVHLLERRP